MWPPTRHILGCHPFGFQKYPTLVSFQVDTLEYSALIGAFGGLPSWQRMSSDPDNSIRIQAARKYNGPATREASGGVSLPLKTERKIKFTTRYRQDYRHERG